MKNKGFLIGLLILLAVFVFSYFYFRQYRQEAPSPLAENLPVTDSEEAALENKVGIELPEGVEKAKLGDLTGGSASGIATRESKEGRYELNLIASLPEIPEGKFYQGWLARGDEIISVGRLEEKKGGWSLQFSQNKDLMAYNQVVVSLQEKEGDQPEKKVLAGEF